MFSPEELNQAMKLDWPNQRIVDWHPAHLELIELNKFDAANSKLFDDYTKYLSSFVTKGYSFTAMQEKIYAMFGVWKLWDGVYEAWLIPSNDISRKAFRMHKASKLFFDYAANKLEMKRLQITVCSRNIPAYKWAKVCYFEDEGILRNYGPQGDDYYMMSRVF
jgi:hypothetical protein